MTDLDARVAALLPCPFCGHETPEFERMGTSSHSCIVNCGNCGCSHESGDEYLQSGQSWNRRAELQKPALHAPVTLPQRISELVEKHDSLRAAARVLEVDPGYLSRLASGEKCEPGATLLRRLGLRQIIIYERV